MNAHTEVRKTLSSTVAYIGNTGRRAFDAVVFELANTEGQVQRTVVLKTSGCLHDDLDTARCQRMARRLRALGFRQNWASFGHPTLGGVGGTVRMFRV